jgi:quinol-cytochrome oxidoreductase complex cytochrome b subunit
MDNTEDTTEKKWSMKDFNYPVPEHAKKFGYAVGGVTFVGFILLIITGIIMTFFFTPTVNKARDSVLELSSTPWGLWLRSFHSWLAETVVFLIILHLTRIIFTGSYRGSRKSNWFSGIGLMVIALAFLFSGTVVKWDQEGYEAYRHLVEQVELLPVIGAPISAFIQGTPVVMRMFVTHTLVLPLLFLLFLIPHLVLMKLNGLSPLPGKKVTKEIKLSTHITKIFGWSFVIYGIISYLAMQFPAVLYPGPYAGVELTKPPWILLVLYQFEDWFGIKYLSVFPLLMVVGLILIPYIDSKKDDYSITRKIVVWSYIIIMAIFITFIIHVAISPPVQHLGG